MTNLELKIGTFVALAAAALGLLAVRHWTKTKPAHPPADASPHRDSIDRAAVPLTALFNAPEGSSPCESAYNAILASRQASEAAGKPPMYTALAPKADFMAHCEALPPPVQSCMVARYAAKHRDECERILPAAESVKDMFEVAPSGPPRASAEPPAAAASSP